MSRKLFVVILVLFSVACAKAHKKDPPPCDTGTNVGVCATEIREHTAWTDILQSSQTDPKTNAVVPGSEKTITLTYEFFPGDSAPLWKRSMLIEGQPEPRAMVESGSVKAIDGSTLILTLEHSTCDDPKRTPRPSEFKLYYRRLGHTLDLDTQKIETKKINNIGDIFGQAIGEMLTQTIRSLFESAFSFGSASVYLQSGHGRFTLARTNADDLFRLKSASVGCFSAGAGFSKVLEDPK